MWADGIEVLLVEDNPGDIYLISQGLKFGAIRKRVHVVTDGAAALKFLWRTAPYTDALRPDLILLDLNLPKLDGRRVLESVKRDPELKQIPVIVFSTSDTECDVVMAYENHANCYLTKPSDLDAFLETVCQIEDYWLNWVSLPV